jgi:ABC-2 type transport system ATP-binding protein
MTTSNQTMTNPSQSLTAPGEAVIHLRNLTKVYPGGEGRSALDGLSLSVNRGDFFGLLGRNGAGKTTLVSILCGMLQPTSGSAEVCGRDVAADLTAVKTRIGVVPQNIALYEDLTPKENLEFFGRLYGLRGGVLRRRVDEALALTGLDKRANSVVATLSGGMQRLANLAAAILHRPALLLLDEPTLGIDAHARRDVIETLAALSREGTTLLFTTHYMGEVQRFFSRVAIIDKGALLAEGRPADLLAAHPGCADLEQLFFELTEEK